MTILDAGPLVAFLAKSDAHHEWAKTLFRSVGKTFLTCEAVLTEAFHLLHSDPPAQAGLRRLLLTPTLRLPLQIDNERGSLSDLMVRYQNLPMSLADACLVRLSEMFPVVPVATVDSDFTIYRRNRREVIPLLHPTLSNL